MYVGETISINDLNDAEILCLCETMEDAKAFETGYWEGEERRKRKRIAVCTQNTTHCTTHDNIIYM